MRLQSHTSYDRQGTVFSQTTGTGLHFAQVPSHGKGHPAPGFRFFDGAHIRSMSQWYAARFRFAYRYYMSITCGDSLALRPVAQRHHNFSAGTRRDEHRSSVDLQEGNGRRPMVVPTARRSFADGQWSSLRHGSVSPAQGRGLPLPRTSCKVGGTGHGLDAVPYKARSKPIPVGVGVPDDPQFQSSRSDTSIIHSSFFSFQYPFNTGSPARNVYKTPRSRSPAP